MSGENTVAIPAFGPPLASAGDYHRLARHIAQNGAPGRKTKVAVLSTYTVEFIKPALTVELARVGIDPALYFGGFGQLEAPVFDEQSALYEFAPDVVVIAIRIEDTHVDAVARAKTADGSDLRIAAERTVERLTTLAKRVLSARRCVVLVANFSVPDPLVLGVGDASVVASQSAGFAQANDALRKAVADISGCYVWDYAGLVRSRGSETWTDTRLWYLARIPIAAAHHGALAQHLARTVRATLLPSAKVLVVDLDNTIWGGVLGDDGVDGIVLGDEYPGSEFKALQRRILALRDRGILIVASSKNDQPVAEDAFRNHPEMVIRWEDLAAHRINWGPKSLGMIEMAEELSLGLDAFVFLDDNPIEQAEVRVAAPSVKVLDWEPWGSMNRALANCPWFDTLSTSAEDFSRAELYAKDRQRREESVNFQSVEEFLASLEMHVDVGRTGSVERDRVSQLIAKTNQFNLTGRRRAASEIALWSDKPGSACVAQLRLRDRFGDQGLIAAAVLLKESDTARIDVFVMSCRVMNRQVEFALLAYLCDIAREWGCREVVGEYIPSARNSMVREMYARAGFIGAESADEKVQRFTISLENGGVPWPQLIARHVIAQ